MDIRGRSADMQVSFRVREEMVDDFQETIQPIWACGEKSF